MPEDYLTDPINHRYADRELHAGTRPFARESVLRSWWSVGSSFALLVAAFAGATFIPWWPVRLLFSLFAALMLVRGFILYHDFMHGAILPRSRAARAIFYGYGALALTPPRSWRDSHNFHHANVGRIDGSDTGSFPIMTTEMWRSSSPLRKFGYRLARHPLTILLSYLTVFLINVTLMPLLRRPSRHWDSAVSILVHAAAAVMLWMYGGFTALAFALLLPMFVASAVGSYFFYAQHSFPGLKLLPEEEWTAYRGAIASSSYLRMGPILRWFTGNIGFHHVHHLNSLIPFYRLPEAMEAIPELNDPVVTTLRPTDVVACFRANLWDETQGRMVRYTEA